MNAKLTTTFFCNNLKFNDLGLDMCVEMLEREREIERERERVIYYLFIPK